MKNFRFLTHSFALLSSYRFWRMAVLAIFFLGFLYGGILVFAKGTVPSHEPTPFIETGAQPQGLGHIAPEKDITLSWPTPDLERMKREGCVADGLLSGYNKPEIDIPLASSSNCYYFHRALETWRSVPDFNKAHAVITQINRPDALYGMFIAEAIDTKSDYYYRDADRPFDFKEMCKSFSKNFWGEHTCKPSLAEEEYRAYLRQITRDAMDSGIQVFLFGQIKHQEEDYKKPKIDNVIRDMRAYAADKNMTIVIGAQTGDITRKSYLQLFDFIDGGIGLRADGTIESGPCFSKYYKKEGDWCWPLMWHDDFASKAHNVITYLDWNGQHGDDMHTFALLSTEQRHRVLRNLHSELTAQDIGFLLPLLTPLPHDANACRGPRKSFYSPSPDYTCPDIDVINDILRAVRTE